MAVVDAIGEYQQTSIYCVIRVKPVTQVNPPTLLDQTIDTDLSERKAVCGEVLTARTVSAQGKVTYSSSDPSIANVDENTGEITVLRAGEVTIVINAAENDAYKSATVSYTLTVEHHFSDGKCDCGELMESETESETESDSDSVIETESDTETMPQGNDDSNSAGKVWIWIVVAVVLISAGGAAVWVFVIRKKKMNNDL